jgi:hypothetical protein
MKMRSVVVAVCTWLAGCAGDDAANDTPGTCEQLSADELSELTHSYALVPVVSSRPGSTLDIDLGKTECCYSFEAIPACAEYSVTPQNAATIDPVTGVLTIDPATPSGTTVHVVADVQDGAKKVELDIHVYTPEAMPQVGSWRESKVLSCADGSELDPVESIEEIEFWADGTYSVTWHPFEIYRDYWGPAALDLVSNNVNLGISGGNFTPTNFDGTGTFELVDANTLKLQNVWLGTKDGTFEGCGHVLKRAGT